MKNTYKAIIFDMDGVITDTMPYHMNAWRRVLGNHGVTVSREDIYKREGQKGINSVEELFNEHGKRFVLGEAKKILLEKEELFKKIFKRKFITGSRSFIKLAHKKGYSIALVTGTSRHEAHKLLPKEIWDSFKVKVCGCDVQNGKPHPEPYLTALHQLGLKPTQAFVIENAPFGIASAKGAGLKCFALETSLPKRFLKQADKVFKSYKELIHEIKP